MLPAAAPVGVLPNMATKDVNILKIQLVHGTDKYELLLEADKESSLTVEDLVDEVARLTKVPPQNQKLIFKGKSLKTGPDPLQKLGLRNNSRIMLIGKKISIEEDENYKCMIQVETEIERSRDKYEDIVSQFSAIENGYLNKNLESQAVKKLQMKLASCGEELQKHMERLDGLKLIDSMEEIRTKRKSLIIKIQELLDKIDKTQGKNKDLSEKNS